MLVVGCAVELGVENNELNFKFGLLHVQMSRSLAQNVHCLVVGCAVELGVENNELNV